MDSWILSEIPAIPRVKLNPNPKNFGLPDSNPERTPLLVIVVNTDLPLLTAVSSSKLKETLIPRG